MWQMTGVGIPIILMNRPYPFRIFPGEAGINTNAKSILTLGPSPLRGEGWGEGESSNLYFNPLTLALSREGRGRRIKVKGVNAFVLVFRDITAGSCELFGESLPTPQFSKFPRVSRFRREVHGLAKNLLQLLLIRAGLNQKSNQTLRTAFPLRDQRRAECPVNRHG